MSAYAVDTNAIIFHAGRHRRRLGRAARAVFAEFDAGRAALHVPAAVVAETWFLQLGGKVGSTKPRAFWNALARDELVFVEMTSEDVLRASELDWDHDDPFDRLIVATALRLDLPLLTADERIRRWGGVEVVW